MTFINNVHTLCSIAWIFLKLGLTSFGGPVAHLGFFRDEFVSRRGWMSDKEYADIIALCQFLPGPASSQVGMVIGMKRAGIGGAIAAWLGFTLPSTLLLIGVAIAFDQHNALWVASIIHALMLMAVAVIIHAIWQMGKVLCPDWSRRLLMAIACIITLVLSGVLSQFLLIVGAGLIGPLLFRDTPIDSTSKKHVPHLYTTSLICLGLLAIGFFVFPLLAEVYQDTLWTPVDALYRAGALVFGGGHVVLPLLEESFVAQGLLPEDRFLAGYGAAQAVPGPLFTFAAFIGASLPTVSSPLLGGLIATVAIFLPSFLLVIGILPLWEHLKHNAIANAALVSINAAVVGLLAAALIDLGTTAIQSTIDVIIIVSAFIALTRFTCPPWLLALGCCGISLTMYLLSTM